MPFQKGQSGNPGGRPRLTDVQLHAREYTKAAIETLVACLDKPRERVPAAVALLDRGWGKPSQAITGADGGALRTVIEVVTGVPPKPDDIAAEISEEDGIVGFGK